MIFLLCFTTICLLAGFFLMTLAELETDMFEQLLGMFSGAMLFTCGFVGLPITIFIYFGNFGFIAIVGMFLLYFILCISQDKLLQIFKNKLK